MICGLETEYGFFPCGERYQDTLRKDLYREEKFTFLPNGGRLYWDELAQADGTFSEFSTHKHPEYATPECSNPLDLIGYDRAGELILLRRLKPLGFRVFKN